MRFTLFLSLLLVFCTHQLAAQRVKGKVIDGSTQLPMYAADVLLLNPSDSSLIKGTLTDDKGVFTLDLPKGNAFKLRIRSLGFYNIDTLISGNNDLDLGTLAMNTSISTLSTVEVKEAAIPIQIKNDTVEYNANAYKVAPNSVAEDLLKKLPGVEVDQQSGSVKALGKDVKQILVDGKPFFGDDPRMATKNLPADAIDKVTVYERTSSQSAITGMDDGSGETTIDIRLKPNRKAGSFGRFSVGYGTDDRYLANGSWNKYTPKSQLSLLGGANNTNQSTFTSSDLTNFGGSGLNSGGGGRRMGGNTNTQGDGITTSYNAGLNYAYEFANKSTVNTNYIYTWRDQLKNSFDNTQYFIPGNNFRQFTTSGSDDLRKEHRARLDADVKIDSLSEFQLRSNGRWTNTENTGNSLFSLFNAADSLYNKGTENNNTLSTSPFGRATGTFLRRFKKKDRFFSAEAAATYSITDREQFNEANWDVQDPLLGRNIDQRVDNTSENLRLSSRLQFVEPFKRNRRLEMIYGYSFEKSGSLQNAYNRPPNSDDFSEINPRLTNDFISKLHTQNADLTYQRKKLKFTLQAGASVQNTRLVNDSLGVTLPFQANQWHLIPKATLNWKLPENANLRIRLDARINAPSISNLQPVLDNSNPTNQRLGNSQLKVERQHFLRVNYNKFSTEKLTNIFGFAELNYTFNKIISATTISPSGLQLTRPINEGYGLGANAFVNYGFSLYKNIFTANVNAFGNVNRSPVRLNNELGNNLNGLGSSGLRLSLNASENLSASASGNAAFNYTQSSLQNAQNTGFWNYSTVGDLNWTLSKIGVQFRASGNFQFFPATTTSVATSRQFLDASVSKFLNKSKSLLLKVGGYNLLGQREVINRSSSTTALSESTVLGLGRYFLVSIDWNPRRSQDQNERGARMMNRMMGN